MRGYRFVRCLEMFGKRQQDEAGVDGVSWPAIGRRFQVLTDFASGFAGTNERKDFLGNEVSLRIARMSNGGEGIGIALLDLVGDSSPASMVGFIEARVETGQGSLPPSLTDSSRSVKAALPLHPERHGPTDDLTNES